MMKWEGSGSEENRKAGNLIFGSGFVFLIIMIALGGLFGDN